MNKTLLLLTLLTIIFIIKLNLQQENAAKDIPYKVQIYRDEHGIPHIVGKSRNDISFGIGYAEAQDRAWNLFFKKKLIKGQLSQMFGESILESDKYLRNFGFYQVGQMNTKVLSAQSRAYLQSYCEGINTYVKNAKMLPFEFYLFWAQWEDFTVEDVMANLAFMTWTLDFDWMYEIARQRIKENLGFSLAQKLLPFGQQNLYRQVTIINDQQLKQAGRYIPHRPQDQQKILKQHWANKQMKLGTIKLPEQQVKATGSNAWAIGGQHTANGKPILANDPHLGQLIPSIFYLVQIQQVDDNNNTVHWTFGAMVDGMPSISLGRSQSHAWGATASYVDNKDVFYETIRWVEEGNNQKMQYLLQGQWKDMKVRQQVFKVKFGQNVIQKFYQTHRGPLIQHLFLDIHYKYGYPLPQKYKNNHALSISSAMYDPDQDSVKGFMLLTFSKNFQEFSEAGGLIKSPNVDTAWITNNGSYGYTGLGRIPKRQIPQMGSFIKDGSTTLYDMKGYISPDKLPKLQNPKKGYVAMCNNKFAEDGFDGRASLHQITTGRAYRLHKIIEQKIQKKHKFTVQDMIDMQLDVKDQYLSQAFPYVLKALDQVRSLWSNVQTDAYFNLLSKWNYQMPVNSIQASLYHVWERNFQQQFLTSFDYTAQQQEAIVNHAFFEIYQFILFEKMGNKTLGVEQFQVCRHYQNQNLTNMHPCLYNAAKAFKKLPQQLKKLFGSSDIKQYRWGKIHASVYKSLPWSQIPIAKNIFGRSYQKGGNSRTLNVGIFTHQLKNYNTVGGAIVRFVTDLNTTMFSYDTGANERPWNKFYDNWLGKDKYVQHVHRSPLKENIPNWQKGLATF